MTTDTSAAGLDQSPRFALGQIALNQAATLARDGRYAAAEALLSQAPQADTPEALDLLARILAQQGRLHEVADLWTRLLAIQPGHAGGLAGLRRLTAIQARAATRGALLLPVLGWAVVALTVILFARAAGELIGQIRDDLGRIADREGTTAPPPPAQAVQPPVIPLSAPGVRVTPNDTDLVVAFEDPLFVRGTRLAPGARERLIDLGSRLEPYATSIAVSVIGITDDLPVLPGSRYRDNAGLALARATVVFDTLRQGGSLPAGLFSLQAFATVGGTGAGPQSRRTAEIRISPARARASAP